MDAELAFAGAGTHPSEAIANLSMSTRGFQLRWGRRGISKRGTGAFPLLVGCGVNPTTLILGLALAKDKNSWPTLCLSTTAFTPKKN